MDGGLVGYNANGDIEQSFASGDIGGKIGGGLVGINGDTRTGEGVVNQCYATGAVKSQRFLGGLIGDSDPGVISHCYSIGKVGMGEEAGGLMGDVFYQYEFDHSYWDITTSGREQGAGKGNVEGVTGLTDAELKSALPDGFDPQVWGQGANINNGYPYLLANPPPKNAPGKARH